MRDHHTKVKPGQSKATNNTGLVEVLSKDVPDNRFMWVQGGTDQTLGRKVHYKFGKVFPHVQETAWAETTKESITEKCHTTLHSAFSSLGIP